MPLAAIGGEPADAHRNRGSICQLHIEDIGIAVVEKRAFLSFGLLSNETFDDRCELRHRERCGIPEFRLDLLVAHVLCELRLYDVSCERGDDIGDLGEDSVREVGLEMKLGIVQEE